MPSNYPFDVINALKLTILPEELSGYDLYLIDQLGAPDVRDMMIWGHVNRQRDSVIVRAWLRGYKITHIARAMGIARTTVYRAIEDYQNDDSGKLEPQQDEMEIQP